MLIDPFNRLSARPKSSKSTEMET